MSDQPHTSRREQPAVRVCDLAEELGVTSEEVLELARSRNVWVKTPTSKIRKSEAEMLRVLWQVRKRVRENFVRPEPIDPEVAAIRHNLGVTRRVHVRQPTPTVRAAPLTGTAGAAVRRWPRISEKSARQIALEWTARHLFDDKEAAAWWRAGVTEDDAELAATLANLGIRPDHLPVKIRGETVLYRLRDGVAPEQIRRLLRNEGQL